MKVMVTGGAGFIGSHIVDLLVEEGHRVCVVDDLSTGRLENLNPGVNFYRIGVESPELAGVVAREKPDAVIHQAACAAVPRSLEDPLYDARVNVSGTINLLEACRRAGVGKVVYASTAAVYGRPGRLPLSEEDSTLPISPYGVSKLAAEHYMRLYGELYGLRYTVLRYANVYGPRQDASGEGGVVAVFASRLARGEQAYIFGDGEQSRDFVYVKDVARANLLALERGDGCTLNVGTGVPVTVNALFWALVRAFGCRGMAPAYGPPRPGDIPHSCLAPQKARAVLGWSPSVGLEEGLAETCRYYAAQNPAFSQD